MPLAPQKDRKERTTNRRVVADTQVADDFAGLAIENGLTPMAADLRTRLQAQKLQSQLTASAARNDELSDQVKALEAKNATLEANLKNSQATTSDGLSVYHVSEPQTQSEAMTQELSDYQELVNALDDKNAGLEIELSEYKSNPLEGRVERLQGQVEIYKKLLTKDRSGPREILQFVERSAFVSETYYCGLVVPLPSAKRGWWWCGGCFCSFLLLPNHFYHYFHHRALMFLFLCDGILFL